MFGSIYTGLSGLLGFSNGLNVISNNVANLNTPGFKSSQLLFEDLYYQYTLSGERDGNRTALQVGNGLETRHTSLNFSQGELRQTGNDLDVAIDGTGFFVLRRDGEVLYTRAGQFEFDDEGFLVEQSSQARVMSLTGNSGLDDINISGVRTSPPNPTSRIAFTNNLSTGSTDHTVADIGVFDSLGTSQTLSILFTNNSSVTPGSWLLEVQDDVGTVLSTGEIRYQGDGSPLTGFNEHTFVFSPAGAIPTSITLFFGDVGRFSGSTSFSGGATSTLSVDSQNGFSPGSLTSVSFNEDGHLVISYSNGQTTNNDRLALAAFENLQDLQALGGNLFRHNGDQNVRLARPGEDVMGTLVGESIELSNVELTEQFTDLVIIQRGFQASSQIISVSNEMIQQLFDMRSGT